MTRVRLMADVDADLRRRVKVAATNSDRSISEWVEEAVLRELKREEAKTPSFSQVSAPAFKRDWDSEEDSAYDELTG